jgi:ArsR family transcriptional regulator, arsenate/arsenite/antimonite-responsive transcriptional repressor / arsenate reductase (thioredoxin)
MITSMTVEVHAGADEPAERERRAAVFAALADPHRLAIVDRLAVSDRTPGELSTGLDIGSNLLAHHLRTLERAGLVERTRSSADGRSTYVHLLGRSLTGLLPPPIVYARAILFVCTGNSARSQLAAALWNAVSDVTAESAGTRPAARVHPGALRTARDLGLDLSGVDPRAVSEVSTPYDVVVTVCDQARGELGVEPTFHWSIPDPVSAGDGASFTTAGREIRERVGRLAPVVRPASAHTGRKSGRRTTDVGARRVHLAAASRAAGARQSRRRPAP